MTTTNDGSSAEAPLPARRPRRRSRRRLAVLLLVGAAAAALVSTPAVAQPPIAIDTAAPARGAWRVRALGGDRYQVSWTSPTRLPVTSDRPTIVGPRGTVVGAPTVNGRTVQAVVRSRSTPDPARLDVLLSGDRLDRRGRDQAQGAISAAGSTVARATRQLSVDPGVTGPYAVVSSDYTRTSAKVAGMPQPIEMVGHVVEPAPGAVTGPRPLVLFLHGRHEACYYSGRGKRNEDWPCRGGMREIPSQLGYDYQQRLLASQGFTTVSVRVNGINAQDGDLEDGGASARATIVQRHLDYWATIAGQHQVDLNRVVLVGHSRGGEGVDRASLRIPLSAPYRIVGQVLIAPTEFGDQTAPYVPTVTLLPYCDGDVYDLQGQRYTDLARDLGTDDTSLKSSVLIMGANHNFFNTEWTPGVSVAPSNDDWYGSAKKPCGTKTPARLTAPEQRAVGQAYVAGAVRLFTRSEQALLPMFDGSAVSVASAGDAVVLSHAIGGGKDVRRPSLDTDLSLPVGAQTSFCTGAADDNYRPAVCGSEIGDLITPHWEYLDSQGPTQQWFQMSWSKRGQSGGVLLHRALDLSDRTLDLRTIVDPRLGATGLKVRLTDSAGGTALLTPVGGTTIPTLLTGTGVTKLWAQDVRVDPARAAGLDLTRIVRVDLVGDSTNGRVWVADLAGDPGRLPAVGAERAPTVTVGQTRRPEGNTPGWTVAEVPYRLSHAATRPGQFLVVTSGESEASLRRFTVDVAPGQTSGTIPVGYQADRTDDIDESHYAVAIWPTRNLMTDNYLGQLVVVDDDPSPKVTVSRVKTSIPEGKPARWKVTLAAAVDYPVDVSGVVVKGPGKDLTGLDVPASWRRTHTFGTASKPLYRLHAEVDTVLDPGSTSAVLSIPTSKDRLAETKEAVTLRVSALGRTSTRTVTVAASH